MRENLQDRRYWGHLDPHLLEVSNAPSCILSHFFDIYMGENWEMLRCMDIILKSFHSIKYESLWEWFVLINYFIEQIWYFFYMFITFECSYNYTLDIFTPPPLMVVRSFRPLDLLKKSFLSISGFYHSYTTTKHDYFIQQNSSSLFVCFFCSLKFDIQIQHFRYFFCS